MKRFSGFSLLELLMVITLIGIVITMSYPSYCNLFVATRSDILQKQLLTELRMAKHLAQAIGKSVTICPKLNNSCGNDWNQGQIIFIDNYANGKIENKNQIIFQFSKKLTGNLLFYSARKLNYISFNPLEDNNNNGTFSFNLANKTQAEWSLVINEKGRVRILKKKTA